MSIFAVDALKTEQIGNAHNVFYGQMKITPQTSAPWGR